MGSQGPTLATRLRGNGARFRRMGAVGERRSAGFCSRSRGRVGSVTTGGGPHACVRMPQAARVPGLPVVPSPPRWTSTVLPSTLLSSGNGEARDAVVVLATRDDARLRVHGWPSRGRRRAPATARTEQGRTGRLACKQLSSSSARPGNGGVRAVPLVFIKYEWRCCVCLGCGVRRSPSKWRKTMPRLLLDARRAEA